MTKRLHIGVMGAGSVGCYVGGRLLVADAADVTLIGRERLQKETATHGLRVRDFDQEPQHVPPASVKVETTPEALAACDVVLCCVKSAQSQEVAEELAQLLQPGAIVASLQNGVSNPSVLRGPLQKQDVLAGIVGFNVISKGDALFHKTVNGELMLEESDNPNFAPLVSALSAAGLEVKTRKDLAPDQWTKLLVNLNNALSALSDAPTRDLLLVPGYRRVMAALLGEALEVLRAAGIKTAKFRGVPLSVMLRVLKLPTPLVRLLTRAQLRVDPEARSSMWEDLSRRRLTEVDYLNGEIVRLAEQAGSRAPLNQRVVELIRDAEQANVGSPQLDPDTLWQKLQAK